MACAAEDASELLDAATQLPDFLSKLKVQIYTESDMIQPALATEIVNRVLKHDVPFSQTIDLSPFNLEEHQLSHVLIRAPYNDVHTMDISGNRHIGEDLLRRVLEAYPNLQSIYLLNTRQISYREKIKLFSEHRFAHVYDSQLFGNPISRVNREPREYRTSSNTTLVQTAVSQIELVVRNQTKVYYSFPIAALNITRNTILDPLRRILVAMMKLVEDNGECWGG